MRAFLSPRAITTLLVFGLVFATLPRRGHAACIGDCDASGDVTVNELITMVNIALGSAPLSNCLVGDADASGDITINEIIAAVNNALGACPVEQASPTPTLTALPTATATPTQTMVPATPTFSVASTFPQIQATIFNASCITSGCHGSSFTQANLLLEAGAAYTNLVGVTPSTLAASQAGMLRVDPGNPGNSFLITKLTLPKAFDAKFGSRMPLGNPTPLPVEQIDSIRAWVLRGALADESAPAP